VRPTAPRRRGRGQRAPVMGSRPPGPQGQGRRAAADPREIMAARARPGRA